MGANDFRQALADVIDVFGQQGRRAGQQARQLGVGVERAELAAVAVQVEQRLALQHQRAGRVDHAAVQALAAVFQIQPVELQPALRPEREALAGGALQQQRPLGRQRQQLLRPKAFIFVRWFIPKKYLFKY